MSVPIIAITATTRVVHAPSGRTRSSTCVAVRRGGRVVSRWLLTRKGAWVRSAFVAVGLFST